MEQVTFDLMHCVFSSQILLWSVWRHNFAEMSSVYAVNKVHLYITDSYLAEKKHALCALSQSLCADTLKMTNTVKTEFETWTHLSQKTIPLPPVLYRLQRIWTLIQHRKGYMKSQFSDGAWIKLFKEVWELLTKSQIWVAFQPCICSS